MYFIKLLWKQAFSTKAIFTDRNDGTKDGGGWISNELKTNKTLNLKKKKDKAKKHRSLQISSKIQEVRYLSVHALL